MEIELKSYTDGPSWSSFFELLSRSDYKPLWRILGISKNIISQPESIVRLSESYIKTPTSEKAENSRYQSSLEDTIESLRLNMLGNLTSTFAKIIDHYGLNVAIELYDLADQAFVHKKGRFWSIWLDLFSGKIEIYHPLTTYLDEAEHRQYIEILSRQLSIMKEKKRNFTKELSEHFSEGKIVYIDDAIERNCAIQIWQEINIGFETKNKEKIYRWGFDNVDYLTTKKEWLAMKSNCFSIAEKMIKK